MSDRTSLLDTIADFVTPIHREGTPFIAAGAVVTLLLLWLWSPIGWIAAVITIYIAYFFRDPDRVVPLR